MATYEVTSPDGRTLELEGNSPPTEQELEQIFSTVQKPEPNKSLFDKVVSGGRMALPQLNLLPANKAELDDLLKLGYKYSNPIPQGLIDETRDVLGIPRPPSGVEEGQLTPTTDFGRKLEAGVGTAALGALAFGGAKLAQAGVKNLVSSISAVGKEVALEDEARIVGARARELFKLWSKNLSDNFGDEYKTLIKGKTINRTDYLKSLDNLAQEQGLYNIEEHALSTQQRKIKNYIDDVRNSSIKQPEQTLQQALEGKPATVLPDEIPLEQIDDEMKGILAKSYGKQFGYGEHILSDFRGIVGDVMSGRVPQLGVMKARYAPDLGFKKQMFKIFDPYNPANSSEEGNLDRLTKFFKQTGQGKLSPGNDINLRKFVSETEPTLLDNLIRSGRSFKNAKLVEFLAQKSLSGFAQAIGAGGAAGGVYGAYKVFNQ